MGAAFGNYGAGAQKPQAVAKPNYHYQNKVDAAQKYMDQAAVQAKKVLEDKERKRREEQQKVDDLHRKLAQERDQQLKKNRDAVEQQKRQVEA
jgi:hypothetical protein